MNPSNIFCDWITASQRLPPHEPIHSAIKTSVDTKTGEITESISPINIIGKYGSSVQIKSNGQTLTFSGNISAFNEPNNLHGLSLDECKTKLNNLLTEMGYPPFTDGIFNRIPNPKLPGRFIREYTGAKISRLDLTINMSTGSSYNKNKYLFHLQTINKTRLIKSICGTTIYYGKQSDSRTFRIYDKAREIEEVKLKKSTDREKLKRQISAIKKAGLIRFEIEYHEMLYKTKVRYWHNATHEKACKNFIQEIEPMTNQIETTNLKGLDFQARQILRSYLAGENLRELLGKNTFTKYKKLLKPYGYDISNEINVTTIQPKPTVIILHEQTKEEDEILLQN